jgi:hypothetical protein
MLLGAAYMRSGDEHAGTDEMEGALAAFERLGARVDLERVEELLGRVELGGRFSSPTSWTRRSSSRP